MQLHSHQLRALRELLVRDVGAHELDGCRVNTFHTLARLGLADRVAADGPRCPLWFWRITDAGRHRMRGREIPVRAGRIPTK